MAELTLSKNEFRALSAEARRHAIKLLKERKHTLSELARRLNMSSPSMKQHMDILANADIVRQIDEGRKWKYYALTDKGMELTMGGESQSTILIVLSLSGIALVGMLALLFGSVASLQAAGPGVAMFEAAPAPSAEQALGAASAADSGVADAGASAREMKATDAESTGIQGTDSAGLAMTMIYVYAALSSALALVVGFAAASYMRRAA